MRTSEKGGTRALFIILIILVIAAGGVLAYKIVKDKDNKEVATEATKRCTSHNNRRKRSTNI